MQSFIETQFPIARLSVEAYKERKAVSGQTLTRLGKWWGRKPLILIRASIVGMLMPASSNPKKDREIFLKILTMDDEGAWLRQKLDFPVKTWLELAPDEIFSEYFSGRGFKRGLSDEEKLEAIQQIWESLNDDQKAEIDPKQLRAVRECFDALPYAERVGFCERPENIVGPNQAAWSEINNHLNTQAQNIHELVEQLGQRRFGGIPRVGDCFCGGGSIPFEAARIGCKALGSDLNPAAGLLTWASLNMLCQDTNVQDEIQLSQAQAYKKVDEIITRLGVEHNEKDERADAFLYCVEVKPEGCEYYIPLAPSWVIDEYHKTVVSWEYVEGADRLQPKVKTVTPEELKEYKAGKGSSILDSRVIDPLNADRSWSIESLRGPEGLRRWTNEDIIARDDDVFQERLYCIRWVKRTVNSKGKEKLLRRYAAPEESDIEREGKVLALVEKHFEAWQSQGFIPSKKIERGYNTDQPIRERGWTYWHHMFTPRQLLVHGFLAQALLERPEIYNKAAALLTISRVADWNSRMSCWLSSKTQLAGGKNTFLNQALNTFYNFANRPLPMLQSCLLVFNRTFKISSDTQVNLQDARDISRECDIWITDPPYADAVNYHELGDFFLAWYDKQMAKVFPEWTPDARAELAVKGDGEYFHRSMVDIYKNLAQHMPDNGLQMVQFTHQNPAVWADLGMILWAAGLKATAAWTISTETESGGIKKGNYVQGTVCLVLRKRVEPEPGFLDEVYPLVEDEVRRQVASMQSLDQDAEPNFNDADYSLAAYAAALKVLTQYASLDGKDVEHEVFAVRGKNEKSDFQTVIERAIGIACDTLVPKGLEEHWSDLALVERYYLRALDIESRGERRKGMYEELARGFGVKDLRPLLKSDTANGTRMQTASGMGKRNLDAPSVEGDEPTGSHPFGCTPLRHLLFAVNETVEAENDPEPGRQYLRDTFGPTYWTHRENFVSILDWITALGNAAELKEWEKDSEAARLLSGRLRTDHD